MLLNNNPLDEDEAFNDAVRRLAARGNQKREIKDAVFEGSIYACCAIEDQEAISEIAERELFGKMARRISEGLFLARGGSEYFSYWPDETVKLGAQAINHSPVKSKVRVRISISTKGSDKVIFQNESGLVLKPGKSGTVEFNRSPPSTSTISYNVTTELIRENEAIDIIEHEFWILASGKPGSGEFVTVKDSDFWLKGEKWYPVRINYWPRCYTVLELEDLIF